MRAVLVLAFLVLALPTVLLAPPAGAVPPVCLQREETVGPVTVDVWLSCGPSVEVTACVPVDGAACVNQHVGRDH